MISMVFFNGTSENNYSTSKDTKLYSSLISPSDIEFILAPASKESLTVYSFCADGFNNDVKNFYMPWKGVFIVSMIGRDLEMCWNGLCNLGSP